MASEKLMDDLSNVEYAGIKKEKLNLSQSPTD